jgi:hypothetical protein
VLGILELGLQVCATTHNDLDFEALYSFQSFIINPTQEAISSTIPIIPVGLE